jgi:hypothetical protein
LFQFDDPDRFLRDNSNAGLGRSGETLTITSDAKYSLVVEDADGAFSDDNSSAVTTLAQDVAVDTTGDGAPDRTYAAGLRVEPEYSFVVEDDAGLLYEVQVLQIGSGSGSRPVAVISKAYDPVAGLFLERGPPVGDALTAIDGSGTVFDDRDIDSGDSFGRRGIYSNRPSADYETLLCFAQGTDILTPDGPRPVEMLAKGDLVTTMDRGAQALRWVGRRHVPAARLRSEAHLRPIRIDAGALGCGLPERDLVVSPQHRLLVRSKIADRMFQSREVLIPAKKMVSVKGISVVEACAPVTYFHLLFDRHEIVFGNGLPAESLFLGPETLRTLPEAALREIRDQFPERVSGAPALPAARRIVSRRRQVDQLLTRHRKHSRPLLI